MDYFNHIRLRSKYPERIGKKDGFPMVFKCGLSGQKSKTIKKYLDTKYSDYIEYIGIAKDEPKRLERLKANQVSLLYKYGYTEKMAYDLCKEYDLLSPVYSFTKREGCWFCPNATISQLAYLYHNHKELWDKLISLENRPDTIGTIWNTLKKRSLNDIENKLKCMEVKIWK